MRTTFDNLVGYWIVGSLLIWLIFPASLFDILIAPEWSAPNWQCDSLGIPIMQTMAVLMPWAAIAVLFSAGLVFLVVRRRKSGADILDLRLGTAPWNWIVTLVTLAAVALPMMDVGRYVWQAAVPQTISSDCAGRAELVVVTMRGPAVQLFPVLEIALALWILHLRALLLSPRWK